VFVGPNNFFNRATTRLNASHHLSDGFTVGGNFSFADTRGHMTQRGNNVNGLLLGLFRTPPDFNNVPWLDPTTGLHRSYMVPNATLSTAGQTRVFNNPFFTLYDELNDQKANRAFGNINAEYIANTWLKFNYTLGVDVDRKSTRLNSSHDQISYAVFCLKKKKKTKKITKRIYLLYKITH